MDDHFMVSADGVLNKLRVWTLLTSALSHQDLWHILFNMLFFWLLGQDVERVYGYRNFYGLYAFSAVIGSLAHVAWDLLLGHLDGNALGASGAIMGIAVVAAIFDPNRPMSLYGIITVPLKWVVVAYLLVNVSEIVKNHGDGIAYAVHLGGALGGFIFWKMDLRLFASPGRSGVGFLYRIKRWLNRKPHLRIVEKPMPEEAVVSTRIREAIGAAQSQPSSVRRVDLATSQRVDELLEKISRQGLHALTDEERAFLKESSQKYKKN